MEQKQVKCSLIEASSPVRMPVDRTSPFDPPPQLDVIRAAGPIQRLVYPDGRLGWLVTSHRVARLILSDRRFSARSELQILPVATPSNVIYGHPPAPGMFIFMDAPDHTKFRRALSRHFSSKNLLAMKPRIDEVVDASLKRMLTAGCPADLWTFLKPIPAIVTSEMLGVTQEVCAAFQERHEVIVTLSETEQAGQKAWNEIIEILLDTVQKKKRKPEGDIISHFLNEGCFSDEEVAVGSALLLSGGHETTASMLALGTLTLLSHENAYQRLRDNSAHLDNAVEELLRYLSIFQFGPGRTPLEDIDVEGTLIKAGECVTISLPAANRDAERFPKPNELEIDRPAQGHLAFGYGVHQCIGQQLARFELRAGFSFLLRECPNLRLAVPIEEIPFRTNTLVYGLRSLPVEW